MRFPSLSLEMIGLISVSHGLLMLAFLLFLLPQVKRFFVSEKWNGYIESSPIRDIVFTPARSFSLVFLWSVLIILLTLGVWSPWLALVNLALCRYFFVALRWKSLTRGFGAPGFMNYWLAAVVTGLEWGVHYLPSSLSLFILVAQIDFALIMLSAGIYKWSSGYPQNDGMELGMANPAWGYWWTFYRRRSPENPIFYMLNQLAWSMEILAALLMLYPPTRFLGGALIILSFLFILTSIRLGTLCYVVIIAGLLFFEPNNWIASLLDLPLHFSWIYTSTPAFTVPAKIQTLYNWSLWGYLALLPFAHAGLFLNFYAKQKLPFFFQKVLERYTNFWGLIIWRVFSVDLTNFFVQIYNQDTTTKRQLISHYASLQHPRFNHVVESITLTSIFTTLKYYPSNNQLFQDKLLRYARTLTPNDTGLFVFKYFSLSKSKHRFIYTAVAEFVVDTKNSKISEQALLPHEADTLRKGHKNSPIFEGKTPGSYAPKQQANEFNN